MVSPPPPPAPPAAIPKIQYCVRSPWAWVMEDVCNSKQSENTNGAMATVVANAKEIAQVDSPKQLVSSAILIRHLEATPKSSARARRSNRVNNSLVPSVSTLRMELLDQDSELIIPALYGTSKAFDGLDDKDELVRTFQRCRCDGLNLSPPSFLIKWDVTREECKKIIKTLPVLVEDDNNNKSNNPSQQEQQPFAVLKEPMGTRGEGIYFVQSLDEIYDVVERHRRKALDEGPDFLDSVMARKGRIPSWVLQAEVHPCRLLKSRKFHIRSYVVGIEQLGRKDVLDVRLFRRHEVRIAAQPMKNNGSSSSNGNGQQRDRLAHITNAGGERSATDRDNNNNIVTTAERQLLQDIPELRDIQQDLEVFCATIFRSIWPDLVRRVSCTQQDTPYPAIRKFTVAGLDLMMTQDGRFYLLEVNVNPEAPAKSVIPPTFQRHLTGMLGELVQLLIEGESPSSSSSSCHNFVPIFDLLDKQQQQKETTKQQTNGRH